MNLLSLCFVITARLIVQQGDYTYEVSPPHNITIPLLSSMLKPDLYDRFEQAQINILSAVLHGPSALSNFQKDWSQLTSDLDEEIRLRQVDQEVMDMAHATASVVSMLAHSFLNLHNKASNAYDNLTKELLDTLNGSASQPASSRLQSVCRFLSIIFLRT